MDKLIKWLKEEVEGSSMSFPMGRFETRTTQIRWHKIVHPIANILLLVGMIGFTIWLYKLAN